jgi:hypothetical protein
MVAAVGSLIKEMILVILVAVESRPAGKITRLAGVFICFHLKEGGLPPKIWVYPVK